MTEHLEGHLFVVHGDLTKLSCDGILLPQDDNRAVSSWVFEMFGIPKPVGLPWAPLPEGVELARTPRGPIAHEFVDTVSAGGNETALAHAVRAGLARLRDELGDAAGQGRVLPLLALPLPGTGNGTFAHRRGAVVRTLVPELEKAARDLGVDVALVVNSRRDYSAVQGTRAAPVSALEPSILDAADRLGEQAGRGELSVFVGAGVSVSLGLPSWKELVNALLRKGKRRRIRSDGFKALARGASRAKKALGRHFDVELGELLHVQRHALGHGLIASLRARQTVTTNFDRALELAMATTHGQDLRVMVDHWAASSAPWLLKLHGTAGDKAGVVFTAEDYAANRPEGNPLYGLVQGLLMTSHLLFVGFSLKDENYLKLASPVADLYDSGKSAGPKIATALDIRSLRDESRVLDRAFRHISFDLVEEKRAARALEIFLDRVAWTASQTRGTSHEYLMDPAYADLVEERQAMELRSALEGLHAEARRVGGDTGRRVMMALADFGGEMVDGPRDG